MRENPKNEDFEAIPLDEQNLLENRFQYSKIGEFEIFLHSIYICPRNIFVL